MRWICGMVAIVLMLLPASLRAQLHGGGETQPELDLALGYDANHGMTTQSSGFWAQGGQAHLTGTFYHGLGMVADVTGTHAGGIGPDKVGLTLITTTFGPSYTWALPRRGKSTRQWKIFSESLVGVAFGIDSVFPGPTGAESSANSLALQLGGGADLDLTRDFGLRLLQADWLRTQLPNGGTNVQNNLQLGAGILWRIR